VKAEDIEAAMAAMSTSRPTPEAHAERPGPRLIPFAAMLPPPREPQDAPAARRHVSVDPAIPDAYRGQPGPLLDRCADKIRRAVTGMVPSQRYGALLMGPSGCGKSSAAAWAMRRWCASAGAAGSRTTLGWLDAIEGTDAERRYRLGSGDPEFLSEAYRAEWLVIDDVGMATSVTLVQLVLARRYQACLPTIVTTGLERDQLVNHIGAATVRRMVEFEGRPGVMVDCHRGESK
jgi:hypothetical protein